MSHENGAPTNRRRTLAALSSMLVVLSMFAVLATIVGPGRAIEWVGTYLIPVAVVLCVAMVVLALLVWALKRLPDPPYRDRLQ